MFLVAPAVLAAIPGVVSGVAGAIGQRGANKANREEAQRNRNFQEKMRNTAWQSGVEDMRAAGLNPALAYSSGPAASPGGSMSAPQGSAIQAGLSSALSAVQARKQMRILDAQAKTAEAEATDTQNTVYKKWHQSEMNGVLYPSIGDSMLQDQQLLTNAQRIQAENLARISGIGGSLAQSFNPAISALGSQAGRGLTSITDLLQGVENLNRNRESLLLKGAGAARRSIAGRAVGKTGAAVKRFFNRFNR